MADIVSPDKRSLMMAGIRPADTKPELLVRKTLFFLGYRYRLHKKDLPGKPDIVLPKYRTVIFVNGCYWHGHENCSLFRYPKSRKEFWEKKIGGNIERDRKNIRALLDNGWRVAVVWECSLKGKNKLATGHLEKKLSGFIQGHPKAPENFMEISGTGRDNS